MANETPDDGSDQRRMTSDPERIREWAETRDAVPVSIRGGEGHGHSFARQDQLESDHEEYTWDEFTETFENENLVFVYHDEEPTGAGLGHFEIVERKAAFDRASLGRNELEDQLREGETVTTEIVETQVVQTEVIERDTIESKVVDTELVERQVVDSELLNRELIDTEFVSADVIEVITDETRLDTIDEVERYTVESRVVDVDVEQHDEVERDEVQTNIELESVQRSILESDVVSADVVPEEVVDREVIQSKRGKGDTVRSELLERRTVEEQIDERARMRFALEDTELLESDVVGSDVIEGEVIDVEEYDAMDATAETGATGADTGSGAGPAATSEAETISGTEGEAGPAATSEAETTSGTEGETGTDTPAVDTGPVELSDDDQGKPVVDETGEQIGLVAEVEEQTAYIDPKPGLTDRLKARLDWGSHGDDDYPVEASEINEITDDELIIQHGGDENARTGE